MDWKNLFLSFEGRISRQPFWLGSLALGIISIILQFVIVAVFGGSMDFRDPNATPSVAAGIAFAVLALVSLWPSLAITVKRWHDRDKSGWWTLIILIPIIGAIWMFVENGFLRGTDGRNRFGDDPLAGQ